MTLRSLLLRLTCLTFLCLAAPLQAQVHYHDINSPYDDPVYRERALAHAKVIGQHPESFPDTHGSPAMGMAYTALAANVDSYIHVSQRHD
ncbi:MAG: hypothetical protein O2856_07290 [Planctomycetota bacterium]|nr:hypothetical protein [Planctomycetota bacterium]